jgi:hypothetical protein
MKTNCSRFLFGGCTVFLAFFTASLFCLVLICSAKAEEANAASASIKEVTYEDLALDLVNLGGTTIRVKAKLLCSVHMAECFLNPVGKGGIERPISLNVRSLQLSFRKKLFKECDSLSNECIVEVTGTVPHVGLYGSVDVSDISFVH